MLLQVVEGARAVQNSLPSSWIDEPHEKILWALVSVLVAIVSAIVTYIGKQLLNRQDYDKHTRLAVEKLNNPRSDRSDRSINGKTNSAQLLNYVIDDIKEIRLKQDDVVKRFESVAHKDDIKRLDAEIRDIRKRLN